LLANASAGKSAQDDVFAGNRALGRIALAVAAARGGSRVARLHESGALRVRFPNVRSGDALDAVILNTAGGMTGGDRFDLDIAVGAGARLAATTAAAEKVYRSLGPDCRIAIKLAVGAGAALDWLPQETILFDRVKLARSIDVELAPGGNLLLAEAIVFGRAAMGEAVVEGRLFDRWRVRLGGALTFAESVRLDGDIARRLSQRAIAGGGIALASVLKIPGDESDVAAVRAAAEAGMGEVGVSAWNGLALARLVAHDGAALRRDLIGVIAALRRAPPPRLWLN